MVRNKPIVLFWIVQLKVIIFFKKRQTEDLEVGTRN